MLKNHILQLGKLSFYLICKLIKRFLAERINLIKFYSLKVEDENKISPFEICEEYALKKGFLSAKSGRPDAYKAGIMILNDAFLGFI